MQFAANTPSFFILRLQQPRHVIGNPNLLCCLFLVMDVETTAYIAFKDSVSRVAGHSTVKNPAVLTGVVSHPVFHLKWTASIEITDVDLQATIKVLWMHILCPAIARLLFESAPDEIQPALVEVITKLVGARHPDHDGRSISNHSKTLFAFSQLVLSPFLQCNVPRYF